MGKSDKMIECKHCGAEIAKSAKICPQCGGKNSKPLYQRPWFIAIVAIVLLLVVISIGGKDEEANSTKEIVLNSSASGETQASIEAEQQGSSNINDAAQESEESKTEAAASSKTTIDEQIILEYNGLTVTAKEYITDSFLGDGIKVQLENNTDQNVKVGCKALIVNNYMITDLFSSEVAAGKKANDTIYLLSSELKAAGIDSIGQIELYLYVYDSDSYTTLYEAERVVIQTSNYANMDTTPSHDGTILYEQDGIKIVGKFVDENSFWGTAVLLYLQNDTDRNITVSCENMSINDYMVTPYFYSNIYSGKMAIDDITILSSQLEENGIEKVEKIELTFHIYDSDSYQTIVDTDIISFSAQ